PSAALAGGGSRRAVETGDIGTYSWRDICLLLQPSDQFRVGLVGELVLAAPGRLAGIEIGVAEIDAVGSEALEQGAIPFTRGLETLGKQPLGLRRGRLEGEGLERSYFRQHANDPHEEACEQSGPLVRRSEFAFVLRPRVGVHERISLDIRNQFLYLVALLLPRHLRHLRDRRADRIPERADGEVLAGKHILHLDP